jgi:hypothetical protein
MAFKGFNVQYPEYEVLTPQTKLSFTVRSLNVSEEEKLKGSLVTPVKIADHLNKCLFDALIKKPKEIEDYDTFLKSVTLKDRDALLYGLYHITYEDIRNYQVTCTQCAKEYPITIKASETFNFNAYPADNILANKIGIELPVTKGVIAYIKQPTLFDEIKVIRELASRPGSAIELITETLIVDRFEQDRENSKEPLVYKAREDVYDAYMSLPARDKRLIFNKYEEEFGRYGIELKMRSHCSSCGNDDMYNIDLAEQFFRSLYSA